MLHQQTKSKDIDSIEKRTERLKLYELFEEHNIKIPSRNGKSHKEYVKLLISLLPTTN